MYQSRSTKSCLKKCEKKRKTETGFRKCNIIHLMYMTIFPANTTLVKSMVSANLLAEGFSCCKGRFNTGERLIHNKIGKGTEKLWHVVL